MKDKNQDKAQGKEGSRFLSKAEERRYNFLKEQRKKRLKVDRQKRAEDLKAKRDGQMIDGELRRLTGRRYQVDWSSLDESERREVMRLLRDISGSVRRANESKKRERRLRSALNDSEEAVNHMSRTGKNWGF